MPILLLKPFFHIWSSGTVPSSGGNSFATQYSCNSPAQGTPESQIIFIITQWPLSPLDCDLGLEASHRICHANPSEIAGSKISASRHTFLISHPSASELTPTPTIESKPVVSIRFWYLSFQQRRAVYPRPLENAPYGRFAIFQIRNLGLEKHSWTFLRCTEASPGTTRPTATDMDNVI